MTAPAKRTHEFAAIIEPVPLYTLSKRTLDIAGLSPATSVSCTNEIVLDEYQTCPDV